MTLEALLITAAVAALAYANGANDVSKGIATLVGSGVASYRHAMLWGAVWTGVGGWLGAIFAKGMLTTFGAGLRGPGVAPTLAGSLAALVGATGWVLVATRTGLPVSTTHAIVGSLGGVAVLAYGAGGMQWSTFGGKILLPLLMSPLLALAFTGLALRAGGPRTSGSNAAADCLCAEVAGVAVAEAGAPGVAAAVLLPGAPELRVARGSVGSCATEHPQALRLTLGHAHWATSGATSLARGMNDAPKIVALALAASALGAGVTASTALLFALVTAGMVAGSVLAGRRVTRVLAERVTPMDNREGFAANLVTAALVITGAVHGLPMSTTHVAAGGIFGAGAARGTLDTRTLRDIVLAWVVTLPAAGLLGAASYAIASIFSS
ncbi:MAG: inorganic phosphate transporter [Candidatus Schekmanbacteria bacterium]|nr:inorganic phosphate transporter [Candidatus Schekmanbacteria bacterium]